MFLKEIRNKQKIFAYIVAVKIIGAGYYAVNVVSEE